MKETKSLVAYLSSISVAILLLILSEGWLVASVGWLGARNTFVIFTPISIGLSLGVFFIYKQKRELDFKPLVFIENWIINKEKQLTDKRSSKMSNLILRILDVSKILGLVLSSLTIGPIPTTILIGFLKYKYQDSLLLILLLNVLFFVVWIAIYSGTVLAVKNIL